MDQQHLLLTAMAAVLAAGMLRAQTYSCVVWIGISTGPLCLHNVGFHYPESIEGVYPTMVKGQLGPIWYSLRTGIWARKREPGPSAIVVRTFQQHRSPILIHAALHAVSPTVLKKPKQ